MQNDPRAAGPAPRPGGVEEWDAEPVRATALLWRPVISVTTRGPVAATLVPGGRPGDAGEALLVRACTEAREWRRAGRPATAVVPLPSGPGPDGRAPADALAAALARSGLDPARLVVEVPLRSVPADRTGTAATLRDLRAMGVRSVLDGTGDGCAALTCVASLPFDFVRLARSFLARVDHGPEGDALLGAVATLHRHRAVAVVADGIETEAQLCRLAQLGVPYASGRLPGGPPGEVVDVDVGQHGIQVERIDGPGHDGPDHPLDRVGRGHGPDTRSPAGSPHRPQRVTAPAPARAGTFSRPEPDRA